MATLSVAQKRGLDVIVAGRLAWSTNARLRRLGVAQSTLRLLHQRGLIEPWDLLEAMVGVWATPAGRSWTLTLEGAALAGVVLGEVGVHELPRWLPAADPVRPIRVPRYHLQAQLPRPELVVDPSTEEAEPREPAPTGPPPAVLDQDGAEILLFGLVLRRGVPQAQRQGISRARRTKPA